MTTTAVTNKELVKRLWDIPIEIEHASTTRSNLLAECRTKQIDATTALEATYLEQMRPLSEQIQRLLTEQAAVREQLRLIEMSENDHRIHETLQSIEATYNKGNNNGGGMIFTGNIAQMFFDKMNESSGAFTPSSALQRVWDNTCGFKDCRLAHVAPMNKVCARFDQQTFGFGSPQTHIERVICERSGIHELFYRLVVLFRANW